MVSSLKDDKYHILKCKHPIVSESKSAQRCLTTGETYTQVNAFDIVDETRNVAKSKKYDSVAIDDEKQRRESIAFRRGTMFANSDSSVLNDTTEKKSIRQQHSKHTKTPLRITFAEPLEFKISSEKLPDVFDIDINEDVFDVDQQKTFLKKNYKNESKITSDKKNQKVDKHAILTDANPHMQNTESSHFISNENEMEEHNMDRIHSVSTCDISAFSNKETYLQSDSNQLDASTTNNLANASYETKQASTVNSSQTSQDDICRSSPSKQIAISHKKHIDINTAHSKKQTHGEENGYESEVDTSDGDTKKIGNEEHKIQLTIPKHKDEKPELKISPIMRETTEESSSKKKHEKSLLHNQKNMTYDMNKQDNMHKSESNENKKMKIKSSKSLAADKMDDNILTNESQLDAKVEKQSSAAHSSRHGKKREKPTSDRTNVNIDESVKYVNEEIKKCAKTGKSKMKHDPNLQIENKTFDSETLKTAPSTTSKSILDKKTIDEETIQISSTSNSKIADEESEREMKNVAFDEQKIELSEQKTEKNETKKNRVKTKKKKTKLNVSSREKTVNSTEDNIETSKGILKNTENGSRDETADKSNTAQSKVSSEKERGRSKEKKVNHNGSKNKRQPSYDRSNSASSINNSSSTKESDEMAISTLVSFLFLHETRSSIT